MTLLISNKNMGCINIITVCVVCVKYKGTAKVLRYIRHIYIDCGDSVSIKIILRTYSLLCEADFTQVKFSRDVLSQFLRLGIGEMIVRGRYDPAWKLKPKRYI